MKSNQIARMKKQPIRIVYGISVLLVSTLLLSYCFFIFIYTKSQTDIICFHFTSSSNQESHLIFPPGSKPHLESLTIENTGPDDVQYPHVYINDENYSSSLDDLIASCRRRFQDDEPFVLCLSQYLSKMLCHVGKEDIGNSNHNFPNSTLEALNYYGYSQCGPSSNYLVQMAHQAGLQACALDFYGHVVAEIKIGKRWIIIDPDRSLFYSTDNYKHVASLKELRDRTFRSRTVGRGFSSCFLAWQNDSTLVGECHRQCEVARTSDFPLSTYLLSPGEKLTFHRDRHEQFNGAVVTMDRPLFSEKEKVRLPYPGLKLALQSDKSEVLSGRLLKPLRQELNSAGEAIVLDLARETRDFSRIFSFMLEFDNPVQTNMTVDMRYARNAIPELKEGINTFRLINKDTSGTDNLKLSLRITSRVRRSWFVN